MIGKLFNGRFKLLEEFGRGGMGAVYRAEQVALGREVALKLMHSYLAQAPGAAERFHREARVLAKLAPPALGRGLQSGRGGGHALHRHGDVPRRRLESALARGRAAPGAARGRHLDPGARRARGRARLWAWSTAISSRATSSCSRRMRKANRAGDRIKVLDFGLAFLGGERPRAHHQQGPHGGDARVMAPEQCRGEEVDGRSDIYALGCTLYEMLTGAPPFGYGEENGMETMAAHLYRPPQRPSVVRWDLGVPTPLEEALMRRSPSCRVIASRPPPRCARRCWNRSRRSQAGEARGAGKKQGRPEASARGRGARRTSTLGIFGAGAGAALFAALGAAGSRSGSRSPPTPSCTPGAAAGRAARRQERARRRREDSPPKRARPPVLLCGAEEDLQQMAKAIGAGVFDYVPLPLDAAGPLAKGRACAPTTPLIGARP